MKFAYRKRCEFNSLVLKCVKRIQQMDLLVLLMYRWKRSIDLIKYRYSQYRKINKFRIDALVIACNRVATEVLNHWAKSTHSEKIELISKYLINELYRFSRGMCKYKGEIKSSNKTFTRNFFFSEGIAISEGFGRNFRIGPPNKPILRIFSRKEDLINFLNESDRQLMRRNIIRRPKNLQVQTLPPNMKHK